MHISLDVDARDFIHADVARPNHDDEVVRLVAEAEVDERPSRVAAARETVVIRRVLRPSPDSSI
jgi:hypothetical protein